MYLGKFGSSLLTLRFTVIPLVKLFGDNAIYCNININCKYKIILLLYRVSYVIAFFDKIPGGRVSSYTGLT